MNTYREQIKKLAVTKETLLAGTKLITPRQLECFFRHSELPIVGGQVSLLSNSNYERIKELIAFAPPQW